MSKRCTSKTLRGKPCGAWALQGKTKCALHSDSELAAKLGAKHGQRIRLEPLDTASPLPCLPKTALDVRDVLAKVVAEVQDRKMDSRTANALAYVGTSLLRAIELSELEDRLKRIQEQLKLDWKLSSS